MLRIVTSVSHVLHSNLLLRVIVTCVTHRWCTVSMWGGRADGLNHLRRGMRGLLTVSAVITVEILTTRSNLCGKGRRSIVALDHGWRARVVGPWGLDGVIKQNGRLTLKGLGVKVVGITVSLTALANVPSKKEKI